MVGLLLNIILVSGWMCLHELYIFIGKSLFQDNLLKL